MEKIEVLRIIKREMMKKHVSPAELARKLGANPSSVHGMLKRPTLQVQKLVALSEILGYNFFREIAEQLPYEEPVSQANRETEELRQRIRELEIEASALRRTLKEVIRGSILSSDVRS
jgi:DNA-binding IclR family transcriptional regulator